MYMMFLLAEAATENKIGIVEISAIFGGICIIFRTIAAITPNETDNRWCRKFQNILKTLNVICGLDMKQGVKKYGPK